jgi:hypothetical protein
MVSVIKLSLQRARAALGRRGPAPVLSAIAALTRQHRKIRNDSADAALHNRLNLLESLWTNRRFHPFTASSGRLVPPGADEG